MRQKRFAGEKSGTLGERKTKRIVNTYYKLQNLYQKGMPALEKLKQMDPIDAYKRLHTA
jgi:hypothetical protein